MTFDEILTQVLDLLQREKRLSYRALKVRFGLDDEHLAALKDEIIEAKQQAVDDRGLVLVWTGDGAPTSPATASTPARVSFATMPAYLAEKIRTTRDALAGECKQVTVLFADIKDSTELIRSLDPEVAQRLLRGPGHAGRHACVYGGGAPRPWPGDAHPGGTQLWRGSGARYW